VSNSENRELHIMVRLKAEDLLDGIFGGQRSISGDSVKNRAQHHFSGNQPRASLHSATHERNPLFVAPQHATIKDVSTRRDARASLRPCGLQAVVLVVRRVACWHERVVARYWRAMPWDCYYGRVLGAATRCTAAIISGPPAATTSPATGRLECERRALGR